MDAKVDRGVFELDLAGAILELDLRPDADEVADTGIREEVEPLELEPGFVRSAVDSLQPRLDLGIPTQRRSAAEPSEKRLVVDATRTNGRSAVSRTVVSRWAPTGVAAATTSVAAKKRCAHLTMCLMRPVAG